MSRDVEDAPALPVAHGARRPLLDEAEFALDERADELSPDVSEGHLPVLEACASQYTLVKTMKNDEWTTFLRKLQGPAFRTSTSLPPPGGKTMRLFGKVPGSSTGLIWDRRKLDLSDAFIWPSGYYAKSEFNVDSHGNLSNGRGEFLVTIEDVMRANETCSYFQYGGSSSCPVTGEVLPYNEVLVKVRGADGLVGIFSRSTRAPHLLWAMAIRALVARALPAAGQLPLFVHDPERGMRAFGSGAQSRLVIESLGMVPRCVSACALSRLPVDTRGLPLTELEQLRFHGAWGVTHEALGAIVQSLLHPQDASDHAPDAVADGAVKVGQGLDTKLRERATYAILAVGLRASIDADNGASAVALVKQVVPSLFTLPDPEPLALHAPSGLVASLSGAEYDDLLGHLRGLSAKARSPEALIAVGTLIAIGEFTSGRMLPRISAACQELKGWLDHSSSTFFRLQSWRELRSHDLSEGPEFTSFVTHRAVANRTVFYNELLDLLRSEENHNVLQGMNVLQTMVSELHHPCLRLEMLQHILGLDEKYDLKLVSGIVALALRVISETKHLEDVAKQPAECPTLTKDAAFALSFQIELAARRMQGLDCDADGAWRRS